MENTENNKVGDELAALADLVFDSLHYPSFYALKSNKAFDRNGNALIDAYKTKPFLILAMKRAVAEGMKPLEAFFGEMAYVAEDWPSCYTQPEAKEVKHVAHLAEAVERAAKKGKDDA